MMHHQSSPLVEDAPESARSSPIILKRSDLAIDIHALAPVQIWS